MAEVIWMTKNIGPSIKQELEKHEGLPDNVRARLDKALQELIDHDFRHVEAKELIEHIIAEYAEDE